MLESSYQCPKFGKPVVEYVALLTGLAELHRQRGNYQAASAVLRRAEHSTKLLMTSSDAEGVARSDLAFVQALFLADGGQLLESEALHNQVLEDQINIFGQNHPKIAASLNRLAQRALQLCKLDVAEERLYEAIAMKRMFDDSYLVVASESEITKARLAFHRGEYTESLQLSLSCLAAMQQIFGETAHPMVAQCHWSCGEARRCLGMLQEAKEDYDVALAMQVQCFKTELHVDVASSVFGMGICAMFAGEYSKAKSALEHSLKLRLELMDAFGVSVFLDAEVNKVRIKHSMSGKAHEYLQQSTHTISFYQLKIRCGYRGL